MKYIHSRTGIASLATHLYQYIQCTIPLTENCDERPYWSVLVGINVHVYFRSHAAIFGYFRLWAAIVVPSGRVKNCGFVVSYMSGWLIVDYRSRLSDQNSGKFNSI